MFWRDLTACVIFLSIMWAAGMPDETRRVYPLLVMDPRIWVPDVEVPRCTP